MKKKITVTQPVLPPLEEFIKELRKIWKSKIITNMGPYHEKFELALAEYLGVNYLSLFSNGTLALITSLRALNITGEVITTPFSFIATTQSLWWNNIKPVFVDIEPNYFNLDPNKIESAITPFTSAILPVHVYGNPCEVKTIQKIADKYKLKVIYDSAHAFGVTIEGNSVMNFGNLSVLSFHATKVFNTIEGGAIICHDALMKKQIDYLKNFGFADEITILTHGINAKMNELQASYGLLQLKYIDEYIAKREKVSEFYKENLVDVRGISFFNNMDGVRHNHSYFPIQIEKDQYGQTRDEVYDILKKNNIHCRRYFYPLISQFPMYKGLPSSTPQNLPVATKVAEQILCLPIHPNLKKEDLIRILHILKQ